MAGRGALPVVAGIVLVLLVVAARGASAGGGGGGGGGGGAAAAVNGDRLRAEQIRKQAKDAAASAVALAAASRRLHLDRARHLRLLSSLHRNLTATLRDLSAAASASASASASAGDEVRRLDLQAKDLIRAARAAIADAKPLFDPQLKIQRLKDAIFAQNELLARAKKRGAFASLIAAKSIPKPLHCLAVRLTAERIARPENYADPAPPPHALEDPAMFHYAIFSDNVLAASVVVRSAVANSLDPSKHVFHVVTDRMNLGAMQVIIRLMDLKGAHYEVKAFEDYTFLNSSYVPVLRQLESANLQKFYFENKLENATKDASNMKFRNPKYLSMLNHLRFYLPEMYPKLHRILFLDDDVVVQRDLTGLWKIDMDGKVNGAVETCFGSFHRYWQYMNFSHPLIKEKFNPNACGWAYGMNFFDLDSWRREKSTEQYHYWQSQNENRTLWKLGTLPPGLITFYSTTKPLEKSWHVLGLGYNPSISMEEIRNAAVVHFNGNMKPWLDIGMNQFRHLWTKYVDYDDSFIRQCNFAPP
uniref:Hexosyltransferase n=1 Tax=Oryza meridionalis TaxID=40149 RepID=A0A0E0CKV1_9ORYZ